MKTKKPYSVHFVCRGNTFRSRLAAAYFAELTLGTFRVTSSGITAADSEVKTIESYTKAVAKKHLLTHGLSGANAQTTNALLDSADVIVFMNKDVYDQALKAYRFDHRKSLVWHVKDVDPEFKRRKRAEGDEAALDLFAEHAFETIRRKCHELKRYLTHTAWVDIVNKDNQLTGLRLPIAWATDRGLWHRGVHVVVRTVDNKFVVGKRTPTIVFAPGRLEISLGGGVDVGERPIEAAQREMYEEIGVKMPQTQFQPLFKHESHAYHPRYNKLSRCHVYVYSVTLPLHSQHLTPQPGEVAELRLLSTRQIKQLLTKHRLAHFGRLSTQYKFYDKAVAGSLRAL